MAEVATIGAVMCPQCQNDSIGGVASWFRDKTINKLALLALHAFSPHQVKDGSNTARRVERAKKALKFFLKISPFSDAKTIKFLKARITEKIKMTPEAYFETVVNTQNGARVGCIDGMTTAACITFILGAIKVAVEIVKKNSGQTDDDIKPNEEEYRTDILPKSQGTPTNTPPATDPPKSDNTMLFLGVGLVAVVLLTRK